MVFPNGRYYKILSSPVTNALIGTYNRCVSMIVPDEQLMERVVGGDMDALGVLFERHKQSLYSFLLRFTAEQGLAEDVVLDAFLRVYEYRKSFNRRASFKTWLFTIAHNLAIDAIKKSIRQERFSQELIHEAEHQPASEISDSVVANAETEQIRTAIAQLPAEQREVLILRVYHELSYREIATITKCNEETVRVRAHRGRQTLKRLLSPVLLEEHCAGL